MLVELELRPVTFCGAPSGSDVEIQSYYAIKSRKKRQFLRNKLEGSRQTHVSNSQFHCCDANYNKFCYITEIFS